MKHPTIAIQLTTLDGIAYDMPDDWMETVVQIASMINAKYQCGVDVVYGLASKKGFEIINKEVEQDE